MRIATSFNSETTADEILEGINLKGKRIVITGGASGIGLETARSLAKQGAEITLAVRNIESGKQAIGDIIASTGNSNIHVEKLDLCNKEDIINFVSSWKGTLDILINNAGVMNIPELKLTNEGFEEQFATNYLGHFALAVGLHEALAQSEGARIVSVSSVSHLTSPVIFDDINFKFRPYDPELAYGQAKSAVILFAVGVSKYWSKDGITANALMPGAIATNLQRHMNKETLKNWGALDDQGNRLAQPKGWKTAEQGAATSVLLAVSPSLNGISGRYFEDCNEAEIVTSNNYMNGVAKYALDSNNAERLWDEFYPLVKKWFK
ncbi:MULTISPECIES: SDR family NAD(P)-dependent oxidoreductase [unclassified Enterococcus]|uniref:SDR family NAD(P)-dependent oxidoreductase n=1 Tax=unclassified Enterococcus TaxID=2608891 RepID=UPI001903B148|nr:MULTISPECIES: SDR family NAD(P)-dependent oxidoreductase [unclassified Enterococcus]MBK0039402.1 SDR family NAD(P)-dependent oxidoreductase [Enterococcus sp. S52]MBK0072067.1 SDR family NAD(P)-dependent oxidoreductase [Enterococcus sp. S53]MBK0142659.1 SDR family NAD(P)-dependent oxidoreductase [Enterococcus sp. S76]MBK0146297.1 SDR family NAD(P)-dependent oxidoreductase [Enterococcus sp. S77]